MSSLLFNQIPVETFLNEYWQKKPLLFRQAMPEIATLFEPDDLLELAGDELATSRLLSWQNHRQPGWRVTNGPFQPKHFKNLPPHWTLLVQAVDHFSYDLSQLWQQYFSAFPSWRRDDVMISYAPAGGSVGQHFDYYDVFLAQAYGERRWQLGKYCDGQTELVAGEPLKILPDMGEITFDEILAPGDILYVPPGLSHYGVAQNDCLTCSFGFRMPNSLNLADRLVDGLSEDGLLSQPLPEVSGSTGGEITSRQIEEIVSRTVQRLAAHPEVTSVLAATLSEVKFPDSLPDYSGVSAEEFLQQLQQTEFLILEPAQRLNYIKSMDGRLKFWANGQPVNCVPEHETFLRRLADGQSIPVSDIPPAQWPALFPFYQSALFFMVEAE